MFARKAAYAFTFLLLGGASAAHAVTYDALADFSTASNPNGVWSYGEGITGTSFTPFVNNGIVPNFSYWQTSNPSLSAPIIVKNTSAIAHIAGTAVFPTDVLDVHPGPVNDVIVNFKAPTSGTYTYAGLFEVLDFVQSNGVTGLIYHNGAQLYLQNFGGITANSTTKLPGSMVNFSGSVFLAAGDNLSFAVGNGGNYLYDSTGFNAQVSNAQVSAVPLPAALPLLAVGVAALGIAGRRRKKK